MSNQQKLIDNFLKCRTEKEAQLLVRTFYRMTKDEQRDVLLGLAGTFAAFNDIPADNPTTVVQLMEDINKRT